MFYFLDPENQVPSVPDGGEERLIAEAWLAAQKEIWEQRLDRLELYVEKLKKKEKSNACRRKSQ